MTGPNAKGDAFFARLMPEASEAERAAAKERLQALIRLLLRAEEERIADDDNTAIRANDVPAVESDSSQ